jgi:Fe-S-cluster containining protein
MDDSQGVCLQHSSRDIKFIMNDEINCRPGCGACCIAPSISSPIPGMEQGKPAGVPCIQLDEDRRCRIFGQPERPSVCGSLKPTQEMCGSGRTQALFYLSTLDKLTSP